MTPYASVRFSYGSRHDDQVVYTGGRKISVDRRLTNVKTYAGSTLVSDYQLTYSTAGLPKPSRVTGIKRCDGSGNCLPAATFTWNDVGSGNLSTAQSSRPRTSDSSGYEAKVGDFNGDGSSDLVWVNASSSGLYAYGALSDGDGTFATAQSSRPRTSDSSGYEAKVGDFNGDGKSDLVWMHATSSELHAYVALSDGDGTFAAAQYSRPWARQVSGASVPDLRSWDWRVGDFNGDGKSDLVMGSASTFGLLAYVALSDGDGTFTRARVGEVRRGNYPGYGARVGDFNGDGTSDLAWVNATSSGLRAYVMLASGDGTFLTTQQYSRPRTSNSSGYDARVGDFNGDGKSDLVWVNASSSGLLAYVALSDGDGTFATAQSSRPRTSNSSGYDAEVGDFNGDGVTDVLWEQASSGGLDARVALSEAPADHGRIRSIGSTTGPTFTMDYAPLTDGTVYAKDSGTERCSLPCLDLQAPLYVVKEVTKGYGGSLTHRTTYRYGGAKANVAGRGFLGFRWIEAKDGTTGVLTSTEYRQDFPYIGQVSASSRFLANETVLNATENTWSTRSLNAGKTKFPYVSQNVAQSHELENGPNNDPVKTVTTTRAYDSYGNPTTITVRTVGAGGTFTKTTTNTYTNNTTRWHLGRLTCAKVRSQAPGQTTRTRASGFGYSTTTGLLIKEVVEPRTGDVTGCVSTVGGSGITLITAYAHDGFGNRTTVTLSGPGITTRATTTAWGERTTGTTVLANGRFAVTVTNALGHVENRWYSGKHGRMTRLTGPNSLTTTWLYDNFGRQTRETRADGTQTNTAYGLCSTSGAGCPTGAVLKATTTRTGAPTTVRYVERRGLKVRTRTQGFNGTAIYEDTGYDNLGRVIRRSRPYFTGSTARWRNLSYDKLGRLKRETRPNGSRTDLFYDGLVAGKMRQRIRVYPAGSSTARTTSRERDALGRLLKVTDPLNNSTSHTYDVFDNLLTTTDSAGNVSTLTYDIRGRKLTVNDPDMGRWRYVYNGLGDLTSQTDAKSQTVTLSYDKLGRLIRRVESEGTTAWTYDTAVKGKGKLHRATAPNGYTRTHTYDTLGRASSAATTISGETFTVSRTYDSSGRVRKVTYPKTGFAVEHVYNVRGYLHKVRNAATTSKVYWTAGGMSAEGQITQATLGNGVVTRRTYDSRTGRITSIKSGPSSTTATVQDLGYVLDSLGNLTKREDFIQDVYESFGYDNLNRLTGGTVYNADTDAALAAKSYSYNAIGNIVNKSDVGTANYGYGSGNRSGAGDAGPHAVVSAGGYTYAYDDNGNMTSGAGRTLTWTSFNKPKSITTTSTATAFVHGPGRERIQQTKVQGAVTTTIKYVGNVFEQVAKTGAPTKYVHYIFAGSKRVAIYTKDNAPTPGTSVHYLHQDHLGSVDTITNASGGVVERLSYDAWGKRRVAQGSNAWRDGTAAIAAATTPRGFTDHEHLDDFELVHMNGRVYEPELGRFLSADPLVHHPESTTQGLNRYTYVFNKPLSFIDPSGFEYDEYDNYGSWSLPDFDQEYGSGNKGGSFGGYGTDLGGGPFGDFGAGFGGFADAVGSVIGGVLGTVGDLVGGLFGSVAEEVTSGKDADARGAMKMEQLATVSGRGSSRTFDAGYIIRVEPSSRTLGVDNFRYEVSYHRYDADGQVAPAIRALDDWGNPNPDFRGYAIAGGGEGWPDRVFVAPVTPGSRYVRDAVRWQVSIPLQPSTHGNSAGWNLTVYGERKEP